MRTIASIALSAFALLSIELCAQPAVFPLKAARIVVPAPPGGGTDILARILGQKFGEIWGQQVVIDNRSGAGGIIGTEIVARAAPDGYTLLVAFTSHVTNPSLHAKLPYDTVNDFAPVSMIAVIPSMLVVHPSVPVKSVKELVAFARTRPGQIHYASAGSGSATHLSTVLFESMAGVKLVHVPYKGSSPALNDLLGGQVSLMFGNMASTLPHARSGRLRALGVTSAQRSAAAPDLPTMAETGLPGYEATAWFPLLAPAKTPPAIIGRINADVVATLRQAEVRERIAALGGDPMPSTPAELGGYIRAEIAKWAKVIQASGAKAE